MGIIELDGVRREFSAYRREGLRYRRTRTVAVDGLTLAVEPGEAVGYIGANGSGKSTTIKMLTGILTPTAGRVRVCGLDPVPSRKALAGQLGVLFGQRSILWWDLPLRESFPILAAMHGLPRRTWRPRFDALVASLALAEFLERPVRQLSLGQRMRGELAAALLHSPAMVVLDEPTIGLDMLSKERLRAFLAAERAEHGTTLLLTTHDMGDVQRLCPRMIIIDRGRLVFDGTEAALLAETGARRILTVDAAEPLPAGLTVPAGAEIVEREGVQVRIAFPSGQLRAAEVLSAVSRQVEVVDMSLAEPAIEDLVRIIYERAAAGSAAGNS